MITLYSGIPGSGKSYKMVAQLDRVRSKYFVVHNIDGLSAAYLGSHGVNFVEYCAAQNMEVVDFFSKDYQVEYTKAIKDKYDLPVLVIIDEGHEWFSKRSKNLMMWLSYHRHLNQEIWLVAHRSTNIPSLYRSFIEIEYRAKSGRFLGIPGLFIYNKVLGGVPCGFTYEVKHQRIFAIYKSQNGVDHIQKGSSVMLIVIFSLAAGLVGLFLYLPQKAIKHSTATAENAPAASVSPSAVTGSPVLSGPTFTASQISAFEAQSSGGSSADIVSPSAELIPQAIKTIAEKYAYVGYIGKTVLLESRYDGRQLPADRVIGSYAIVDCSGIDYCDVRESRSGKIHRFHNIDRRAADRGDGRAANLPPEG